MRSVPLVSNFQGRRGITLGGRPIHVLLGSGKPMNNKIVPETEPSVVGQQAPVNNVPSGGEPGSDGVQEDADVPNGSVHSITLPSLEAATDLAITEMQWAESGQIKPLVVQRPSTADIVPRDIRV